MRPHAELTSQEAIVPLRARHRQEMNCQIVHDSIHRRDGWALSYALHLGDVMAGFGSVAVGGPWKDKPTFFEFYVLPEYRARAFDLFEAFLATAKPRFLEVQTNERLAHLMALTWGGNLISEKIVFHDQRTTSYSLQGAVLRRVTADDEIRACLERRQGGGEWVLESDGKTAARGGILFHYNRPYGDVYMEVAEPFQRRGLGSYLVQELKRISYELGAVPCARCNPTNVASRRTLAKAGFAPFAHILTGTLHPSDPQRHE
jgi:GNAT superfamily N-acetyltransferase